MTKTMRDLGNVKEWVEVEGTYQLNLSNARLSIIKVFTLRGGQTFL